MPSILPRAVIDTNIFIRFLLKSSGAEKLFEAIVQEKFLLITCEELLQEVLAVIKYPRLRQVISLGEAKELENFLRLNSVFVVISPTVFVCRDKKDNMLLDCAVIGQADFLVTEDEDLLVLKKYQNIKILTLKEFLKELENN